MTNSSIEVLKRVEMIIQDKKMSGMAFAREIGVNHRTLNSNLNGESKPSFELIIKIADHFPEISAEWLLRGNGSMYQSNGGTNEAIKQKLVSLQEQLNNIKSELMI